MIRLIFLLVIVIFSYQCNPVQKAIKEANKNKVELLDLNTYKLEKVATDASYGYTKANPIKVGGTLMEEGVLHERRYLNALVGPKGEKVSYKRVGTCCYYKLQNGEVGSLDRFEITYEDSRLKNILFLNIFETGELLAPKGFGVKEK